MSDNLRIFNSKPKRPSDAALRPETPQGRGKHLQDAKRTLLGEMVYLLERDLAHKGFDAGEKIKATIKTRKEALARKKYLRQKFLESLAYRQAGLGPFPPGRKAPARAGRRPPEAGKAPGRFRRPPLNAKTVGTIHRRNFKVEKIIFESRPGFFVTGILYVPNHRRFPQPGILFSCGHKEEGKAGDTYQRACMGLVERGYVVFCYDPLGQGERKQYFDQRGRPFKGPTREHMFAGVQTLLTGVSLANYLIWDGIRALDYLVSRPEVDKKRIGCTGNSGGGTLTTFISALDERVKVAVPSCYITTWRRMVDTAHSADAEQMPPRLIQFGFEQADLLALIAPRPLKILGAWHDYFPIQGAKESYDDVKRIYAAFGAEDRLGIGAGDTPHGYNLPQRQMMYEWFNRWLGKEKEDWPSKRSRPARAGALRPGPARIFAKEKLLCVPSGQVRELGSETVHSLNKKMAREVLPRLEPLKTKAQIGRLRLRLKKEAARLIDYRPQTSNLNIKEYGKTKRLGTTMEKISYESEPGIIIPGLFFKAKKRPSDAEHLQDAKRPSDAALRPETPQGRGKHLQDAKRRPPWPQYGPRMGPGRLGQVLYVHERGKRADVRQGGRIERLINLGYSVLAIDFRGTGETAARIPPEGIRARPGRKAPARAGRRFDYDLSEDYLSFLSQMVGRLLFGQRVLDVVRGVECLSKRGGVNRRKIYLYGRGAGGLLALFAALLTPKVARIAIEDAPVSYKALVDEEMHALKANIVIPGILRHFDIPDLLAALAPLPILVINPLDGKGKRMTASAAEAKYALAFQTYKVARCPKAFEVICGPHRALLWGGK